MTTASSLGRALDALAQVAEDAGLDAAAAREEGAQLAATVAEPARGAFVDWAEQLGRPVSAQAFFEAASRARRWRSTPTTLLTQLANTLPERAAAYANALGQVCAAACTLGEPSTQVAGTAGAASAAQMAAVTTTRPPVGTDAPVPTASPGTPTGGLDPDLLARLQTSTDQRAAMDQFNQAAPALFADVLGQLESNQRRLDALRASSAERLLPHSRASGDTSPSPTDSADSEDDAAPVQAAEAPPPAEGTASTTTAEPQKSLAELLADLDGLVGLSRVKAEIHRQTAVLRVEGLREKAGLRSPTITRHLVFVGNPGTGKTTVARLVAGIYQALGLLSKGQLIEVDRSELVAGYLGQTAIKTAEVVASAAGGVLFIDEAYSLSGDQYGEEAINTLVKEMEDRRDDLVVIVAGYPLPMSEFIEQNPGLASRFRTTVMFDDYTDDELRAIFTGMVTAADYDVGEGTLEAFSCLITQQVRDETFGNGRFVRNTLEAAIGRHAWRLRDVTEPTLAQLRTLLPEDLASDDVPPVEFPAADVSSKAVPPADVPTHPVPPAAVAVTSTPVPLPPAAPAEPTQDTA